MAKEKNILGLDLGTNSIGWSVIGAEENEGILTPASIKAAGSRIIPIDAAIMGDFEKGNSVSQTHDRTFARGVRRLYQRHALRRERLNRVLDILGYLPRHYSERLNRYGEIMKGDEPKIAWQEVDGRMQFLFGNSFTEMTDEFRMVHPEMTEEGRKIAYDWTVYYLRKKALTHKITDHELAWVLHQFNTKRGYNQTRAEINDEENPTEKKMLCSLRVAEVINTGEVKKGATWYEVRFDNGWVYKRQSKMPLDWVGKTKNLIVTTKLNEDGTEKTDANGEVKRSFSIPKDDDWGLLKIKTEQDLAASGKTVGQFIYDALLTNPDQKVIGQLVRVVDRKYYREELHAILRKQLEFRPELKDRYAECIEALYPQNEAYRSSIAGRDFEYLLAEDILLYQRPLKSKKSNIAECAHEYRVFKDSDGVYQRQHLKCIPKSHPLYEEFRVLQWVENLKITEPDEKGVFRRDVSDEYMKNREDLVAWLMTQKEVKMPALLKQVAGRDVKARNLTWNYVEDKVYPMAPVTTLLRNAIADNGGVPTEEMTTALWHIMYSVSDKTELEKAVVTFGNKNHLGEGFAEKLKKQKPFADDYGSLSLKATEKVLQLMRSGARWSADSIDSKTIKRIENIINGEYDENITDRVREKCKAFTKTDDFQGLPFWLAEYVVYGVRKDNTRWRTPDDIDDYLRSFRQHSLNNPIVEQVVMETLRTVRDIWKRHGKPDEIHIELGRDMKNPAAVRQKMMETQQRNERANLRAKLLLREFMNPGMEIEGLRSYSPSQLELFRIYEEGVLNANQVPEDIQSIIKNLESLKVPSSAEVKRYRLWLDQKYTSPYTGRIIPLSKLFTPAYEIEHVIPQSRYFDDSMSNKVICEAAVNKLKDRMLAHEFIVKQGGATVSIEGREVPILKVEVYEQEVRKTFANDRRKMEKLMLDEIPESFISRQMNDSRYISRLVRHLMNNIVLPEDIDEDDSGNRVVVCTGQVTDRLKQEWGVNDVWNHIVLPRFERMNSICGTTAYTSKTQNGHLIPSMPLEQQAGFNKKRIDHRHHAMDAIVIACASRNHVNLLSNESGNDGKRRYDLQLLLRESKKYGEKTVFGNFRKPWATFTTDVENVLREIIVSFKQNLRVINKSNNRSLRYVDGRKRMVPQTVGENWAIRKSLHKETGFGLVNLRFQKSVTLKYALEHIGDVVNRDLRAKLKELVGQGADEKKIKAYFDKEKESWSDVNLKKIEVYYYTNDTSDRYYATRKAIDGSFTADVIRGSVTDTGIQRIMLAHLERYNGNAEEAFSPDGLDEMNRNIRELNGGVDHKPIYKVRKYEKAEKFAVGETGAKARKFVEAAKGTNIYYTIYKNVDGTRSYYTVPFKQAIDCQKQAKKEWKTLLDQMLKESGIIAADAELLCILSPGDLVYVPSEEEIESGVMNWRRDGIYKFVSCGLANSYYVPCSVASSIVDKVEFTQLNKIPRTEDGRLIREVCIPILVDRLGDIIK